mgnify:CR=1 FL=1
MRVAQTSSGPPSDRRESFMGISFGRPNTRIPTAPPVWCFLTSFVRASAYIELSIAK